MSNYPSTKSKFKKAWARPVISKVDLQTPNVPLDTEELNVGQPRSQCIEALRHTLDQTEKIRSLNRSHEEHVSLRQMLQGVLQHLESQQSSSVSSDSQAGPIQTAKSTGTSSGGDQ